jgi:hypothetical protein
MRKNEKDLRKFIAIALAATFFAPFFGSIFSISAADNSFEAEMEIARNELSESIANGASLNDLEVIYLDGDEIIKAPQKHEELPPAPRAAYPASHSGPFAVGDTRPFRITDAVRTGSRALTIEGELIASGSATNVWVLDDADFHAKTGTAHNDNCHLRDITPTLALEIANTFDGIYSRMTSSSSGFAPHASVVVNTGGSDIGDSGKDGKVNFVLYDLGGDGGVGGGYTAGYFSNGDFSSNSLDILHIDIGDQQGYKHLTSSDENDRLTVYGTLAHEFQHMLYYMYFGVYAPSGYESDDWINEALSEAAAAFYTKAGAELVEFSTVRHGALNLYNGSGYRDFLNHDINSLKNYAMERLFAHFTHKGYPGFERKIYAHFQQEYPIANSISANGAKITSMQQAVGDFLKVGTGVGNGGLDTLTKTYFLFMESVAADGGTLHGASNSQTMKLLNSGYSSPSANLWAIRPVAGANGGVVYTGELENSVYYPVNAYEAIPLYPSESSITLTGYGSPAPSGGASHEKLYKLTSPEADKPILKITAPNDGTDNTRYYVALMNAEVIDSKYSSGAGGADLYPLTKGMETGIDTKGKQPYLFVATFYKNVNQSVKYYYDKLDATPTTSSPTTSSTTVASSSPSKSATTTSTSPPKTSATTSTSPPKTSAPTSASPPKTSAPTSTSPPKTSAPTTASTPKPPTAPSSSVKPPSVTIPSYTIPSYTFPSYTFPSYTAPSYTPPSYPSAAYPTVTQSAQSTATVYIPERAPNPGRPRGSVITLPGSGSQDTVNPPTEGYTNDTYQKSDSKNILASGAAIVLSGYKKGAIISGADILALANKNQSVNIKSDIFTFSIAPQLAAEWKLTADSTIEIRVEAKPGALTKAEIEKYSKIDTANASALERIRELSLSVNGKKINKTVWPIKVSIDAAGTPVANKTNASGVYFDTAAKTSARLGGELTKDGKAFEFYANRVGAFGLIVDNNLKKLTLTIDSNTAVKTENSKTSYIQIPEAPHLSKANAPMIPLRVVAETLGGEVGWIESLSTFTVKINGKRLYLKSGTPLPGGLGTPEVSKAETFAPARYAAENFNVHVVWDPINQTVKIYY